jgi:hypothetical protein
MADGPVPVTLDLDDFDALGVAEEIVLALRVHAIEAEVDAVAEVPAPDGYQRVMVTARSSGHMVLSVRFRDLGSSRRNNLMKALIERGWHPDDDADGATRRFPPGSEAADTAFELLATATLAGAPSGLRLVTAVDGHGTPVDLSPH